MPVPVANFTYVPTLLVVQFTDTSTNSPTSWAWDFGDGSTSVLQNPIHTYAIAGDYAVTLVATNVDGDNTKITAISVHSVLAPPVAAFTFVPTLLSVQFTDTSSENPLTWDWDFGDGTAHGTTAAPLHVYAAAGTYTVKLIVTNYDGTGIKQRTINISTVPVLPISLSDFIDCKLPAGLAIDEECKDVYIAQWQLFIQPLVYPSIANDQVF